MTSYESTGVLSLKKLKSKLPSKAMMEKGPVAIIECIQKIPCDPCAHICKYGAIKKPSLIDLPEVNYRRCNGCGECVAACPGLAIFVVNMKYKNDEALVMIPYELLPAPKRGETYEALDREGSPVGVARIIATKMKGDRTVIISIAVKKPLAMIVRNIGRRLND